MKKRTGLFKAASTSSAAGRPRTAGPRSSHGGSIRGKISGPIPIPSSFDDDEFPIRNPGSCIASKSADEEFPIRQRSAGIASPVPLDEKPAVQVSEDSEEDTLRSKNESATPTGPGHPVSHGDAPPLNNAHANANSNNQNHHPVSSDAAEAPSHPPPALTTPARVTPTPVASASATASGSGASPSTHRRANASSTLRYSMVSSASGNTGQAGEIKSQRKKSTLRDALSKLFGRKKKNGSIQGSGGETDRTSSLLPPQQRNDGSMPGRGKEGEPKRSASLPISEYDRALRSHSIGPGDMVAIEVARNSLNVDAGSPGRRRAATTSNTRLFAPSARRTDGEWGGLSPRPVSTHGNARHSRMLAGTEEEDPDMIGRAVTSDMGDSGGEYTHRRRSRSLSGIDATDGTSEPRRRSDEIRYWRESYGASFLSPISSVHPEIQGDENEMAAVAGDHDNGNDDTGAHSLDLGTPGPGGASSSAAPSVAVDQRSQQLPPKTPPQPFDFGTLADMSHMAGMTKITQAANMEARIGGLESRMQRMERAVDQLCYSVPGFQSAAPPQVSSADQIPRSLPTAAGVDTSSFTFGPPSTSPLVSSGGTDLASLYSSTSHSMETGDGHSYRSFGEGQTYIGSLRPPSSTAAHPPHHDSSSTLGPGSTSTIRGATSLPALAASAAEQSVALAAQLEAERASRAALEMQVKKLSERVNALSATMFAMVRDPHKSRSLERLTATPSPAGDNKPAGAGGSHSSGSTPTKLNPRATSGRPPPSQSPIVPTLSLPQPEPQAGGEKQGSVFENDDDSEVDSKRDEEAFLTPREESAPPHSYGLFGGGPETDEDHDSDDDADDPKRKKAARTLSLGELTLGKGRRNVI